MSRDVHAEKAAVVTSILRLVAAGVVVALAAIPVTPAAADEAAVTRGAYLAAAAGCDNCHTDTKNGGAPFAGGRALTTEFGTVTTPNITPDATGIGGWRLADFIRAMRWGIAPDGTHYVTAFPFPYFARMTDGDLADLKTYLDSLTPVKRPDTGRTNSLALLARARDAIETFVAGNFSGLAPPPATGDPAVVRGAYLVAAVGRCGECHTPRTWLGAPDRSRELTGAKNGAESKRAPDITPDPKTGIGNWSVDEIATSLKTGETPDFTILGGSMAEIVRNTARLTDADRRAIAAYLKALPPKAFAQNK